MNKLKELTISGISLPLYIFLMIVLFLVTFLGKLPLNMVGITLLLVAIGYLLYYIGEKLPIVSTYLGGGSVFTLFGATLLSFFNLIPFSSMGAHVSITPNHQTNRTVPLKTRGNVAFFGAFGYELDLNQLSEEDLELVKEQIAFFKTYQSTIHNGTFYRLISPFDSKRAETAWMVIDPTKETAILAHYKVLNEVNRSFDRVKLHGLDETALYEVDGVVYSGRELMTIGFSLTDSSAGQSSENHLVQQTHDFDSRIWVFQKIVD